MYVTDKVNGNIEITDDVHGPYIVCVDEHLLTYQSH